jgi:hypothetical protein
VGSKATSRARGSSTVVASGVVIGEVMTEHLHASGQMGIRLSDTPGGIEQKAK